MCKPNLVNQFYKIELGNSNLVPGLTGRRTVSGRQFL